jgi:hypothetical protein
MDKNTTLVAQWATVSVAVANGGITAIFYFPFSHKQAGSISNENLNIYFFLCS